MIPVEREKFAILTPPELQDNASFTDGYVDTKGYSHLRCLIITGTTDIASDAAPKLTECDTTDGTYTDITSAALAAALSTTNDQLRAIDVDLTAGRKRYIKCPLKAGNGTTGTNLAIIGILSRPNFDSHDGKATKAGLAELVSV